MFVVVIVSHLLAVLFGFCGVVMLGSVLSGPTFDSAGAFTLALACAAWPLALAGIIELLLQIACMLEKLVMQKGGVAEGTTPAKPTPLKPVVKKPAEPASASGQFFRSNPVPEPPVVPPLEEPKTAADEAKKNEPVKQEEEKKEPEKPASGLSFFRVD